MLTKINGRTHYYSRIKEIRKLRRGHWNVVTTYGSFHVEGGKAAGGSRAQWFVGADDGSQVFGGKTLYARSLVECLHLLDNA